MSFHLNVPPTHPCLILNGSGETVHPAKDAWQDITPAELIAAGYKMQVALLAIEFEQTNDDATARNIEFRITIRDSSLLSTMTITTVALAFDNATPLIGQITRAPQTPGATPLYTFPTGSDLSLMGGSPAFSSNYLKIEARTTSVAGTNLHFFHRIIWARNAT